MPVGPAISNSPVARRIRLSNSTARRPSRPYPGAIDLRSGCGYVGSTGIELALFYDRDYADLQRRPDAMPHYVFYEMGRNFYTFGDRHSASLPVLRCSSGMSVWMSNNSATSTPKTRRDD